MNSSAVGGPVQRVLEALERAALSPRPGGQGWTARCPGHDDARPSLSISQGLDGRALVHCHAGCELSRVLEPLGLEAAHLFPRGAASCVEPPVHYVYRDEDGRPLFRVVRRRGKKFHQERADAAGNWSAGLGKVRRVPYRLPEMLAAIPRETLFIPEGEKGAETLVGIGLTATCNPGGAGKWRPEFTRLLQSARRVVVLADNDPRGDDHAVAIARSFHEAGVLDVRLIRFPELPEHGDVSDWLATVPGSADEKRAALLARVAAGPLWRPDACGRLEEESATDTLHETDLGNAARFSRQHRGEARFCHPWSVWLVWDGTRWVRDERGRVLELAKRTVREIYREIANTSDDAKRRQLASHAKSSESLKRIAAMVELAKPDLAIMPSDLDGGATRFLLTVQNGTLDLHLGELRPHCPEDFITRLAPVEFNRAAKAEHWNRFLERILPDTDVRTFLQRFIGVCCTGDIGPQVLLFLIGLGANGKSTLLEVLRRLLGDYAHKASFTTFLLSGRDHSDRGKPRPEILALEHRRLVLASEAGPGRRLDMTLLKELTGGDAITARGMYARGEMTFRGEAKLLLATNHRPQVDEATEAAWRRILQVTFPVAIPESERDPRLLDKLTEPSELSGILNWALDGYRAFRAMGLGPPEAVRLATRDYRDEQDFVGPFLHARCIFEAGASVSAAELHGTFAAWCEANGEEPFGKVRFARALEDHGLRPQRRGHDRKRVWVGLRLADLPHDRGAE